MGYYTQHKLEIIEGDDYRTDYKTEISLLSDYLDCFEDTIKWYNHEIDMRKYSNKYPTVLFKLSGEGEESEDIWIEYYKNGLMQRCKAVISFESYNENKLI